jgi:low temperature requirement protein LtrA
MTSPTRNFLAPMRARSADEPHRVSTPLELFFDLCFVVAVAQAALPLHHSIAEHHVGHGLYGYLTVFFAIWWAWMNFTWFASAYDTDDDVYRITTLVQIAGALVLAAGVEAAFERTDFLLITIGYVSSCGWPWWRSGCARPGPTGSAARRPCATRSASAPSRCSGCCAC